VSDLVDRKLTGEDGSHGVDCRTAMWKERKKPPRYDLKAVTKVLR
jgi:hypothetical protein